jgi:hypothetical protein
MSWIWFAEIIFLKDHCVLETIPCRFAEIYENFISIRFIRLYPSKLTLKNGEVIFCDMLVNYIIRKYVLSMYSEHNYIYFHTE